MPISETPLLFATIDVPPTERAMQPDATVTEV